MYFAGINMKTDFSKMFMKVPAAKLLTLEESQLLWCNTLYLYSHNDGFLFVVVVWVDTKYLDIYYYI